MENLEASKNNFDDEGIFYPPEILNLSGDNVGKAFKEKFVKVTQLESSEVAFIKEIINKVSERKGGQPVIISFSNFKGGCGKSTTSVTFAQFLTNLGIKTILVDSDNMRLASRQLTQRKKIINGYITNMTKANIPIDEIIDFKDKIDPICDTEHGEYSNLISTINPIIEMGRYQVIVIDTPGSKEVSSKNFAINSISKGDLPHSLIAFIADSIVIPSKATSFDRTGSIDYYVQLESFVNEMMFKKVRKTSLAFRVLPVMMRSVKEDYVQEFFSVLEANGIERFTECFRESDKFKNSVKDDTIETYFTLNNAPQKTLEFKNFVLQVFQDLDTAMRKDDFLALQAQAQAQSQTN